MREHVVDLAVTILLICIYAAGTAVTGALGIGLEYYSYLHLAAGDYAMAAYLGVFGVIMLLFAYLFATDKLRSAVQGIHQS